MSRKAEIITLVCTLGCALGTGFMMQNSKAAQERYGLAERRVASATTIVGETPVTPAVHSHIETTKLRPLNVRAITLTSAQVGVLPAAGLAAHAPDAAGDPLLNVETQKLPNCPIDAKATPVAGAMVSFDLSAPCFAGTRVLIAHDGLVFSELLSDTGDLAVFLPALSETVVVTATFATGESVQDSADVDSLSLYDRIVVQWHGEIGMQMRAREFGVGYDNAGKVWPDAGHDQPAPRESSVGYLTSLGNRTLPNPRIAEIYTFPTAAKNAGDAVNLTVETEVTADNCGTDATAQAIQISAGKKLSSQILTMPVPGCDAIGSFLVLNNLLQDLTVASK